MAIPRQPRAPIPSLQVCVLLYFLLTPIALTQCYFVAINVTTREMIQWQRSRGPLWPWQRGDSEWAAFAPYDRSLMHNVAAFVACRRDEARDESCDGSMVAPEEV